MNLENRVYEKFQFSESELNNALVALMKREKDGFRYGYVAKEMVVPVEFEAEAKKICKKYELSVSTWDKNYAIVMV